MSNKTCVYCGGHVHHNEAVMLTNNDVCHEECF